ncbi:MAG: aminoglycoside phosphotransferase [Actinomycetia bacterium]|nr:aminoglycoside phosphotransferase [Actinomycetes bacterium]
MGEGLVQPAVAAAVEVGRRAGLISTRPAILQETNNTVVWLRPEPVVAKVATRADGRSDLHLEHGVATELARLGAEIAAPLPGTVPERHEPTGFTVSLWERVDGSRREPVEPDRLAQSLRRLHEALAATTQDLPSFEVSLDRARTALGNPTVMAALPPTDRTFLCDIYDDGLDRLRAVPVGQQRLHGQPHDANRLVTADGIRWIDFESCCVGPLEWDLAFQPSEVHEHFPNVDSDLLALLRRLNSARVATWCWAEARFPVMRRHGEIHLALLRGQRSDNS